MLQDPTDDLLLAVVCSLRAVWMANGEVPDGATLEDVRVRYA